MNWRSSGNCGSWGYYSGLETAKEEGISEGEARSKAEAVLTNLRMRFGKVPKAVSERVLAIGDLVVLNSP